MCLQLWQHIGNGNSKSLRVRQHQWLLLLLSVLARSRASLRCNNGCAGTVQFCCCALMSQSMDLQYVNRKEQKHVLSLSHLLPHGLSLNPAVDPVLMRCETLIEEWEQAVRLFAEMRTKLSWSQERGDRSPKAVRPCKDVNRSTEPFQSCVINDQSQSIICVAGICSVPLHCPTNLRSVKPDVVMLNAAVGACERATEWQEALSLLDGEPQLVPDIVTYNTLMSASTSESGKSTVSAGFVVALVVFRPKSSKIHCWRWHFSRHWFVVPSVGGRTSVFSIWGALAKASLWSMALHVIQQILLLRFWGRRSDICESFRDRHHQVNFVMFYFLYKPIFFNTFNIIIIL